MVKYFCETNPNKSVLSEAKYEMHCKKCILYLLMLCFSVGFVSQQMRCIFGVSFEALFYFSMK